MPEGRHPTTSKRSRTELKRYLPDHGIAEIRVAHLAVTAHTCVNEVMILSVHGGRDIRSRGRGSRDIVQDDSHFVIDWFPHRMRTWGHSGIDRLC